MELVSRPAVLLATLAVRVSVDEEDDGDKSEDIENEDNVDDEQPCRDGAAAAAADGGDVAATTTDTSHQPSTSSAAAAVNSDATVWSACVILFVLVFFFSLTVLYLRRESCMYTVLPGWCFYVQCREKHVPVQTCGLHNLCFLDTFVHHQLIHVYQKNVYLGVL